MRGGGIDDHITHRKLHLISGAVAGVMGASQNRQEEGSLDRIVYR